MEKHLPTLGKVHNWAELGDRAIFNNPKDYCT